ncbi:uncharacterized protein BT62DRAFT_57351 [Guyanagaster necrorhizus]|uniref:Uncharacterized protein n=1 Tax=Guyanagaster necrorhizus TaxID=856835 RepID=A0A9P7W638_9AGAR|nr:uncharacterized protein BT62DRAFT_57351 [Guyanagaster necrorhizus MCA 3950]KAG7453279.1 hypothetical protein BT62DRAFT_57351 [Guyanagaster necrorhizus MCA 3950]
MKHTSVENTLGAFFIGATLANILFGITSLQSTLYFKNYPNDGQFFKVSIGAIWFLDTLDVAFTAYTSYFYAFKNFGDINALLGSAVLWSLKLHILLCIVIRVYVQAMYAVRLWKFGQHLHRVVLWLVVLVTVSNGGCGIYLIRQIYGMATFGQQPDIKSGLVSLFVTSVTAEFMTSAAMCYSLNKGRTTSAVPNTITIVLTLMRMILMSGFITSLYSVVILITFLLCPDTLIFLGIDCILPKYHVHHFLINNAKCTERVSNR